MSEQILRRQRKRIPLYGRVLIGVGVGLLLGVSFGTSPYLFGIKNEDLGGLASIVIRLLKALAAPLMLFAILDAFVRTHISARRGGKFLLICLVNVSVAFAIGLTIMNTIRPGVQWRGKIDQIKTTVSKPDKRADTKPATETKASLNLLKNLDAYVPKSLVSPFVDNNIISIVLMGLLGGLAIRRVKTRQIDAGQDGYITIEKFIETAYQIVMQMLEWVVQAVPFAVCGAVAQVVGQSGLEVFSALWLFLVVILLGLVLHALVYYPLLAWLVGKKSPRVYLGTGSEAIFTALSTNSSLATVPVTLRCLDKMGISPQSARLSTCVGTNLNHDGITLYEAMAALFLAQAVGYDLALGAQFQILLAAIMAGVGVAGIPEAGLIVLPLVLGAAGLPDTVVIAAIPLIMPVDWIIARCRSAVNVMADMLGAILLDAVEPVAGEEEGLSYADIEHP